MKQENSPKDREDRKYDKKNKKRQKALRSLLVFCLCMSSGISVLAMELGGFDLSIGDELTDDWWSGTETSEGNTSEKSVSKAVENAVSDPPVPVSGSTGTGNTGTGNIESQNTEIGNTDTRNTGSENTNTRNTETRNTGIGNTGIGNTNGSGGLSNTSSGGTSNKNSTAGASRTEPEGDRSGTAQTRTSQTRSTLTGSTTSDSGNGRPKRERSGSEALQTQIGVSSENKEKNPDEKNPDDKDSEGGNEAESKVPEEITLRSSAENPSSEMEGSLEYYSGADSQTTEAAMKLYYYKKELKGQYEKGTEFLLSSRTPLFPLSVRTDGEECEWEEQEEGILLKLSKKSEDVCMEAVLLYESGIAAPMLSCAPVN